MQRLIALTAGLCAAVYAGPAAAQPSSSSQGQQGQKQEHVRGEVVSLSGDTLQVSTKSGETVKLKLADGFKVNLVEKADLKAIDDGKFVGVTGVPQKDGDLRAVEVHIFDESLRGTGEGHRPWDLQPGSTMTNATVSSMDQGGGKAQSQGTGSGSTMTNATVSRSEEEGGARKLSLKYKDGEKTVIVPPNTPIVKIEPGDKSQVVPGAHVFVVATKGPDGQFVAQRANVGKEGVTPPM